MSIKLALSIIIAAMRGATDDHINRVEDSAWLEIEALPRNERLDAIRFANDAGVLSIEHKFMETQNREIAQLLWNEFESDISADCTPVDEWKLEIVNAPRATRPEYLAWHLKPLRSANLPLTASRVQIGEMFGGRPVWSDDVMMDVDLEWRGGVAIEGGTVFTRWDSEYKFYTNDDDTIARIAL